MTSMTPREMEPPIYNRFSNRIWGFQRCLCGKNAFSGDYQETRLCGSGIAERYPGRIRGAVAQIDDQRVAQT